MAALTRRVCGAPLPGSWAQLLVAAPAALVSFGWFASPGRMPCRPLSPSQVFGLVFLLLALDAGVDVVRGGATAGTWVVLLLALGAAGGSKSSLLPVLLGGAGLALATSCVHRGRNRERQPGARTASPPVAGSAGLVLAVTVALALTATTVAGGGAASHLQLLAPLRWLAPWREVTGGPTVAAGGWFVPGLRAPGAAPVALLLVLVLLVQHGWAATSLWLVRRRATRSDPALGLLLGTVATGGALTLVIDHAAASEFYFLMSAAPVAAVLAAWAAHVAGSGSPVDGRRDRACWLVAGAVAGAAAACGLAAGLGGRRPGPADLAGALALPLGLLLAAVLLAACLAAWLRSRGRRRLAGGVALALTGAVWAGYLTQGVGTSVRQIRTAAPAHGAPARTVTVAETAAARWIARHAPTGDVVATNVHCLRKVTRPGCDARSFWVSGLGEHRVLLEGWGYTDESQAARGRHGLPFQRQPFDDPRLLALNDAAFVAPTAHLMALLRDRYGVRWLLADPAASPLSPRLTQLSRLRFASAGVEVLQLPPAPAPLSPPAAQSRPVPSPSRSSRTPSPRPSAGSACGTPPRARTTKEMPPCAAPASSSSPA